MPARPLYWSVRRELWENRSIYIAPLLVAAVVLFGCLISTLALAARMRHAAAAGAANQQAVSVMPFRMAPAPIVFTTFLVAIFYCLDALHGERRDRSILFWKSLPVSDRTTVLSKASIPLVVLPLIGFVLGMAVQLIVLMLSTVVMLGQHGGGLGEFRPFQAPLVLLYGLTVYVLWSAPIYGWLLLVSAWAKRATFLWAVLPPLAIAALERIAFSSFYFGRMLKYRFTGAMSEAFHVKPQGGGEMVDRLSQLTPANFLSTPGLWVGLAFAAVCLAAAVRLRHSREPI